MALQLVIPFESSWTNVLADERGEPFLTSGRVFSAAEARPKAGLLPRMAAKNQLRVDYVRQLNAENPEMTYRVPESYDNAVLGVLARLLGEVRRVRDLEEDHLARRLFVCATYAVEVSAEHDEVTLLATPGNEVPGSGGGVFEAGHPLYSGGEIARKLFGHLALSVRELIAGGKPMVQWTPSSPTALIARLGELDDEQSAWIKEVQDAAKANGSTYSSPALTWAGRLKDGLTAPIVCNEDVDKWSWAGAEIASKVLVLSDEELEMLRKHKAISARQASIPGIAASGNLGRVTAKDLLGGTPGCRKRKSYSMPYVQELPVLDASNSDKGTAKSNRIPFGIIKKSGTLTITLDLDGDLERQFLDQLDAAGVGPFHFGKKGLAFLERVKRISISQPQERRS